MAPALLSIDKQSGSKKKNKNSKRQPKNLTDFQLRKLEMQFMKSPFLTRERRFEMEQEISLSEQQIKVWFQNRRNKERRQKRKTDLAESPTYSKIENVCDNDVEDEDETFIKFWKSHPGIFLLDPQEQTLACVMEPSHEEEEITEWEIQHWILEQDKLWHDI